MWSSLAVVLTALAGSAVMTPMVKRLGQRVGAIDNPNPLSIHATPTARTGGVAIFAGLLLAATCVALGTPSLDPGERAALLTVVGIGALAALIGFLDDRGVIPTKVEVPALLIPAAAVALVGIRVQFIPTALIAVGLTLFYIIGGCSAMNLIDGMDGLAASVAAVASFFFAILCFERGDRVGLVLSLTLMGSVLGFLPHNLRRANIFMGDNGSLFVGLILAVVAVRLTSKPYDFASFAAPILVLGVPIGDTFVAIERRVASRRGVLLGDRRHVYDLLRHKVGNGRTLMIMCGMSALGGVAALAVQRLELLPALAVFAGAFAAFLGSAWWLGASTPD